MDRFTNMLITLVVNNVLPNISTQLVDIIVDFLLDFERRAKETDNPWDDIAAGFLRAVVENASIELRKRYKTMTETRE